MPQYGFRSVNLNTGSVQIDNNYKNLALRQKLTLTSVKYPPTTGGVILEEAPYVTFSYSSGTFPIVALKTSSYSTIGKVTRSGSTFTFKVYTETEETFTAYVFDVPVPITGTGMGLRVRNPVTNEINYDSRSNYLQIGAAITVLSPQTPSATLTSGRAYAIVPSLPPVSAKAFTSGGGLLQLVTMGCNKMVDNVLHNSSLIVSSSYAWPFPGGTDEEWGVNQDYWGLMIIDVTGF